MTFLYSCRHDGDQYRITKLTENLDVESSYLCTFEECDCPAGVRPTCRHREMLPKFIQREAVSTGWMFDYDRGGWVDMRTTDELEEHYGTTGEMPPLPEGVTMLSLEDPVTLHNAIAEAVGEPEMEFHGAVSVRYDETGKAHHRPERDSSVVEQRSHNPPVAGSIPAPATKWRRF